ncbi:uncharacterized protein LOC111308014 [Durio zibethinus]|uniref:Uncharacterized protein LOC111308014 n=1 Tax=Durio zibethinus TaxID=66656 RepID=A0A6P6ABG0_DURZI|nr:uncharacterized protein LOC111308014 [Durio zibethinus]
MYRQFKWHPCPNVSNGHPHQPWRNTGKCLLFISQFLAGTTTRARHQSLIVTRANRCEPKLTVVLKVVHRPVSPFFRFHVKGDHQTHIPCWPWTSIARLEVDPQGPGRSP